MFDLIIQCLSIDEMYGVSENIDIAKGKYKLQTTFKGSWEQYKRNKRCKQ